MLQFIASVGLSPNPKHDHTNILMDILGQGSQTQKDSRAA